VAKRNSPTYKCIERGNVFIHSEFATDPGPVQLFYSSELTSTSKVRFKKAYYAKLLHCRVVSCKGEFILAESVHSSLYKMINRCREVQTIEYINCRRMPKSDRIFNQMPKLPHQVLDQTLGTLYPIVCDYFRNRSYLPLSFLPHVLFIIYIFLKLIL
jgi:hypothetical protein